MDELLYVSIGQSRKDTDWKRKKVSFDWLLDQLEKPMDVSKETYAQYMSWEPDHQARVKDIGGFVGGELSSGHRKKEFVMNRTMLTLDADKPMPDLWNVLGRKFPDWTMAMHSTRKHSPENPRYRVIIPFSRPVTREEYLPISLWVCHQIDPDPYSEVFDLSTHQLERLMYWPSVSCDMVDKYVFEWYDGETCDPDWILDQYDDWRDYTQWPMPTKLAGKYREESDKLGDPALKPGWVGAFCEAYSIDEAISEFLPDVYELTDDGSNIDYGMGSSQLRYTYLKGSSTKGALTYNGWHIYSHHGTDPVFEMAVNAYDLIRIHRWGHEDLHAKAGTSFKNMPSQRMMLEWVMTLPSVKRLMSEKKMGDPVTLDRFRDVSGDSRGVDDVRQAESLREPRGSVQGRGGQDEVDYDTTWYGYLDMNKAQGYEPTANNFELVLENHPELRGRIRYNLFKDRAEVHGGFPWDERTSVRGWQPDDKALLTHYLGTCNFKLQRSDKIMEAVAWVKRKHAYHPVHDYLNGLEWDGKKRLDWALIDCLGAEDNAYVKEVTRKWMIGAVKRIFEPGCKFDNVLALTGGEGKGKSTWFQNLGKREWFTDQFRFSQLTGGNGKQAFESTQGAWIVEIPEMAGLNRSTAEEVKAFLSSQIDKFRPSHASDVIERPRCFVIGSTSNHTDGMLDGRAGGNRRFWVVEIDINEPAINVFTEMPGEYVDQLWAEAVTYYRRGEQVYLTSEIAEMAREEQIRHEATSGYEYVIDRYLNMKFPENWYEMELSARQRYVSYPDINATQQLKNVCIPQLWEEALGYDMRDLTKTKRDELGAVMRKMRGWEQVFYKIDCGSYGKKEGFKRK